MTPWETFLEAVGSLVSPDWGALVLLIPLALALAVGAYLVWVVRRGATAGPREARSLPVAPPPAGIHMPGPSLAPFLVAGGALALFVALLFLRVGPAIDPETGQPITGSTTVELEPTGIVALVIGIVAFAGALLYWGREAMREYDALEAPTALVPAEHDGPPAGVHVPGPSFRPLIASIATGVMLLGLVVGPAVFVAGLLMTVIGLLGWLNDARKEYSQTVKADATGHLENIPAPRFPTGTLIVFAVLFVGALLVTAGIVPPREGTGGGGGGVPPAATQAPGGGGGATAAPAPSGEPGATAAPGGGGAVLEISAVNIAFDKDQLAAPADTPFQIVFANNDAGIPHNVEIKQNGQSVWFGEIFNGVETRTYDVPALPAGTYDFICTVHPNMAGTLTVGG
jgi:plastocyanin